MPGGDPGRGPGSHSVGDRSRVVRPAIGRWLARSPVPLGSRRFWLVQAGVLVVAGLHEIVLDELNEQQLALGIPAPLTSSLMLVPVIYAALTFGVSGAVSTTAWATVLLLPHWLFLHAHPLTQTHLWIELVNMVMLLAAGVVVGQRVAKEQSARRRTESALQEAWVAQARYHGLFEDQPAPVIVADQAGRVTELNSAAVQLLGPQSAHRSVQRSLGVTLADLMRPDPPPLALRSETGERLFIPWAHEVAVGDGRALVQIVLTDITDQQRRQEEQRAFSGQLLAVQEEERLRLARELHDDPLQQLMFLTRTLDELADDPALSASLTDQTRRGHHAAADAASALRKIIQGLRPPVLDDLGLLPALRQLVDQTNRRGTNVTVTLTSAGGERRLPADQELTAYRVVQESLTNVIRHAEATRATVRVEFRDCLVVSVRDDGRGIHAQKRAPASEGGLGLIGVRERVAQVGGTLSVRSRPGRGTTVRITLPPRQPADHRTTTPATTTPTSDPATA